MNLFNEKPIIIFIQKYLIKKILIYLIMVQIFINFYFI